MSAAIIDGKAFAAGLRETVAGCVAAFEAAAGRKPGLAVVLVGEDPASQVYVRSKGKATEAAGMASFEHKLPADDAARPICSRWSTSSTPIRAVDGILVQLPLPKQIDEQRGDRARSIPTRMSTASIRSMSGGSRPGCTASCPARRSAA